MLPLSGIMVNGLLCVWVCVFVCVCVCVCVLDVSLLFAPSSHSTYLLMNSQYHHWDTANVKWQCS